MNVLDLIVEPRPRAVNQFISIDIDIDFDVPDIRKDVGGSCVTLLECKTEKCVDFKCRAGLEGDPCLTEIDCGTGYYCPVFEDWKPKCTPKKEFFSSCTFGYECAGHRCQQNGKGSARCGDGGCGTKCHRVIMGNQECTEVNLIECAEGYECNMTGYCECKWEDCKAGKCQCCDVEFFGWYGYGGHYGECENGCPRSCWD